MIKPPNLAPYELPTANCRRWTAKRKVKVIHAIESGLITLEEAQSRWELSLEEFLSWRHHLRRHGIGSLTNKGLARYRSTKP